MPQRTCGIAVLAVASAFACAVHAAQPAKPAKVDRKGLDRGRYLVQIAGCNDCHTPGYAPSGGKVAEKDWLVGDRLGWRGPWGTLALRAAEERR